MSEFQILVVSCMIIYIVALVPVIAGFVYLEKALLRIEKVLKEDRKP